MATKKAAPNGTNGSNGHVSLAREEYSAFLACQENHQQLTADHERMRAINASLTETTDAQAKTLSMRDLRITYLERISSLQQLFIDQIRDGTKVAAVADLSEFWHQWQVHTHKGVDAKKFGREDVTKYEPDLFKSWRNWVNDSGKVDRAFSESGTRVDQASAVPGSAKEMQEHIIVRLRQDNASLANRLLRLEAEIEAFKSEKKKTNSQSQESRP
jgi:hypothetical protein